MLIVGCLNEQAASCRNITAMNPVESFRSRLQKRRPTVRDLKKVIKDEKKYAFHDVS
jgi:hypothetical protein